MLPCPMGTFVYTVRAGDTIAQIAQQFSTTVYAIVSVNPGVDLSTIYVGQQICIRSGYGYCPPCFYPAVSGSGGKAAVLKNDIRSLWEQHVFWTRLVILSIAFGLPDLEPVTNRLLRNPKDFEAALKPLYGEKAAAGFTKLLTDHLVIAAQLVKAAKAGNSNAAAAAEKDWYANADKIAAALAGMNPYWSEAEWRTMLHEHLRLTKEEAVDILTGKYPESISVFDDIERQALKMADVMADGIVRQFPGTFA